MVRSSAEEKLWNEAKMAVKKSRGYKSVKDVGSNPLDWGLVQKIFIAKKDKHLGGFAGENDIIDMNFLKGVGLTAFIIGITVLFNK